MDDASPSNPKVSSHASDPPASALRDSRSHLRSLSRRERRARLTFETPRVPETTTAWLHVVSGPSAPLIARGVLELSARFLSDGHRVLMVDGGPRLQLHDRFDREMRWGVIECLTGEMPVLGLIQDVGRLGLYLLAHGIPSSQRTHWIQLGRLLDEARPHFGRAVLALDADTPAAVGDALAGRHLEGWWAGSGREKKPANILADRIRIHLSDLELEAMPEAKLEALDARLWGLVAESSDVADAADLIDETDISARLALVHETIVQLDQEPSMPAPDSVPSAIAMPEASITVPPSRVTVSTPPDRASEPVIAATLDVDARVRERLRFLLWMRRVQTEGPRHDPASTPATPAPTA